MSFLTAVRHTFKRPLVQTLIAVSLAFLSWYYFSEADLFNPKPSITARKMHIESIPMCAWNVKRGRMKFFRINSFVL
jgi:hypothetical protein